MEVEFPHFSPSFARSLLRAVRKFPLKRQSPVPTSPPGEYHSSACIPCSHFCRRSSIVMESQTPSLHPPAEKDLYTETPWLWLLPLPQSRAGCQRREGGRNCSHQVRKPCDTVSPHNSVFRTNLQQAFLENLVRGSNLFSLPSWKPRREDTGQDFPAVR